MNPIVGSAHKANQRFPAGDAAGNEAAPLRTGVLCPREGCPGYVVERQSKKGRLFFACNQYPNCDYTVWERPAAEPCPECKHPFLVHGKGALRGRLKCPDCSYKKPLDLEMAEDVSAAG